MKNRTLKTIVFAAAMALTLSITACGGSDGGASSSTTDSTVEDTADTDDAAEPDAEVKDEADTAVDAGGEADTAGEEADAADEDSLETLEAAFEEPEVKSAFDAMLASMQEDGMVMTYEVTGNNFTIIYQFTDDTVTASDEITEALETEMANQEDAFKDMASVFDGALEQKGACTVTVRYLDYEDNVLFEGTYAAD